MVEVKLHDGRTVTVNMYNVGQDEWYSLFTCTREQEFVILSKVFGMTPDDVKKIPPPDFNRLVKIAGKLSRNEYEENKDSPS